MTSIEQRRARRKNKLSENTLAMQDEMVKEGYLPISEIAFIVCNDSYEELHDTREQYGIHGKEYNDAFTRATTAIKAALPYFATQAKDVTKDDSQELSDEDVSNALVSIINKNRKNK